MTEKHNFAGSDSAHITHIAKPAEIKQPGSTGASRANSKGLDKKNVQDIFALAPVQEGMLFHYLKDPNSSRYFEQLSLEISGQIAPALFDKAWNQVIAANEMLRTVFRWEKMEKPVQVTLKKHNLDWAYHDLTTPNSPFTEDKKRAETPAPPAEALEKIKEWDRMQKFDLTRVPFRVTLCKTDETAYVMLITNHHILYDGWSTGILIKEFYQTYRNLAAYSGTAKETHKEVVQQPTTPRNGSVKAFKFKNHVKWLQQRDRAAEAAHWQSYLKGFDSPTPITPPGKPAADIKKAEIHLLELDRDKKAALDAFVSTNKTTAAALLYTAWGLLLQKFANSPDVLFGTTVSGRTGKHKGSDNCIGLFINTIPLRITAHGTQTIFDLVKQTAQTLHQRAPFEAAPLADIREYSQMGSGGELFDSIVVMENYPLDKTLRDAPFTFTRYAMEEMTSYDLTVGIMTGETIQIRLACNVDLFDDVYIAQIASSFNNLLDEMWEHPHKEISRLQFLSPREKEQLLTEFNDTTNQYDRRKTIPQLFFEQAQRTPDVLALSAVAGPGAQPVGQTYRELAEKSLHLASLLQEKGVTQGTIVAVMAGRSLEMIAGILATLAAGGAYLPLDHQYPAERIDYMLKDSHAALLLTTRELAKDAAFACEALYLDNLPIEKRDAQATRMDSPANVTGAAPFFNKHPLSVQAPAYVIYTSGSTGKPKGVIMPHGPVVNLVLGLNEGIYSLYKNNKTSSKGQQDNLKVALAAPFIFDASVQQIFAALLGGHNLCIVPEAARVDGAGLKEFFSTFQIDITDGTPTHLRLLTEYLQARDLKLQGLKHLVIGGEALPWQVVRDFLKVNATPLPKITNVYGPTECCVDSSSFHIPAELPQTTGTVPIGKPMPNQQIHILDCFNRLQPIGAAGQLHISGEGLALGYLNRPELTNESMVMPPKPLRGRLCGGHQGAALPPPAWRAPGPPKCTALDDLPGLENTLPLYAYDLGPGALLYKTGDLARWLPDGNIEFLGRIDHQVKIRGFRVELGEIENRIASYNPGLIRDVAVVPRGSGEDNYLCAYLTADADNLDENFEGHIKKHLKKHLAETLPAYMIPSHFVVLEAMPLTASGKLNRRALPEPTLKSSGYYIPPRNEKDKDLVNIWAALLGREKEVIGIDDNFFSLGGHSLKATSLAGRIHKTFAVELSITEVLNAPTIRQLSDIISLKTRQRLQPIQFVEEREFYPLTANQKRFFLIQQLDPQSTSYNMPEIMMLEGQPSRERFQKIFNILIRRHDVLRASFHMLDGEPVQRFHRSASLPVPHEDAPSPAAVVTTEGGDSPKEDKKNQSITDRVIKSFIAPFNLSSAPLLRVKLVRVESQKHLLMFDMHHIISDGVSVGILIKEFLALYRGEELPPLRVRYRDYILWQQERVANAKSCGSPASSVSDDVLNLPTDFPRPAAPGFAGFILQFHVETPVMNALKALALKEDATLFMLMLSVYTILLAKLSGQEDMVVGAPIAGRLHPDLEGLMGLFINTLALRNFPTANKTVNALISEVKTGSMEAFENQVFQYEELVDHFIQAREMGRNPLFDVMFAFQNMENPQIQLEGLRVTRNIGGKWTSKFDMTLYCEEKENLQFHLEYSTALFKEETIRRFIRYFKNIITAILANPGVAIGSIDMLPQSEKQEILFSFNDTDADFPDGKTLTQLFHEQVERTPQRDAAGDTGGFLTYEALNERAQTLAVLLQEKGVGPDVIVALMVERAVEMSVGILGILKAGGAYMPVSPDYPTERIHYMLKDSGAPLILTQERFLSHPALSHYQTINLEAPIPPASCEANNGSAFPKLPIPAMPCIMGVQGEPPPGARRAGAPGGPPEASASCRNLAYVIYTSGSTGKPKGVMLEHRAAVNRIFWMQRYYPIGTDDVILQKTPFVFDVSVWELFWWGQTGASVYFLAPGGEKSPAAIVEAIKTHRVTTMHFVPSMLSIFLEYLEGPMDKAEPRSALKTLKQVFASGEALEVWQAERFHRCFEGMDARLINLYGPTEAAVDVSCYDCFAGDTRNTIPIGKPIDNIRLYIVNRQMKLQPVGVTGELCIAGVGLARGYLNRPELTAEKFARYSSSLFTDNAEPVTLYHTGDLARWLPDGNIQFLGRIDHQVKIRGFRIETGEIESRLMDHGAIREAVVLVKEDEQRDKFLCAYYVSADPLEDRGIREHLTDRLPAYMVPSYFVHLPEIPLTPNGKLNRKALPEPALTVSSDYEAPSNEAERLMVDTWSHVLRLPFDKIGVTDNFFRLGGHSLKAAALAGRIHQAFSVEVSVAQLFKNPTVRAITQLIAPSGEAASKPTPNTAPSAPPLPLEGAEKRSYYPLSFAQERLYILDGLESGGGAYNMPQAVWLDGDVYMEKIQSVFLTLIERHESFRTSFFTINGNPAQVVHGIDAITFDIEKTAALEQEAHNILKQFTRPFDLTKAPLLRVGLVEVTDQPHRYLLMVDNHHIISDGLSGQILIQEFTALYRDNANDLKPIPFSYTDFAVHQKSPLHSQAMAAAENYWLNTFSGEVPVLRLPYDFPRPAVQSFAGSRFVFQVEPRETHLLKALAVDMGVTLNILLLGIYALLAGKLSAMEDVVIGMPSAGRSSAQLAPIIGMFVNMLPLRLDTTGQKQFSTYLQQVRDQLLAALENENYPYEKLVDKLSANPSAPLKRDLGRNPLFDTVFILQDFQDQTALNTGTTHPAANVTFTPYHQPGDTAKFDLTLFATQEAGGLQFTFEYNTALFKEETIQRFSRYFSRLLEQIESQTAIADMVLITQDEHRQILDTFNATHRPYDLQSTVPDLLDRQLHQTPHNKAASVPHSRDLTYKELIGESEAIAGKLQALGLQKGHIAAILVEPGPHMFTGILAILKSGAAYLPIDTATPAERFDYMLADSNASILVTTRSASANLQSDKNLDIKTLYLDDLGNQKGSYPFQQISPRDAAYIIYTSGSTGRPKGVIVEHRSLANLCHWHHEAFAITEDDRAVKVAGFGFDASVWEIFPYLTAGASITIVPEDIKTDVAKLTRFFQSNRITIAFLPTRLCELYMQSTSNQTPQNSALRLLLTGGDKLNQFHPAPYTLINNYGPTENTVVTTSFHVTANTDNIPIGKPIANTTVLILDKHGHPQPIGLPGELCTSGSNVARGYLNQPELTAERFTRGLCLRRRLRGERQGAAPPGPPIALRALAWERQDGIDAEPVPFYRTGDLAKWLPDGNILFLGRIDEQVQIRGVRIEPGEIEALLTQHRNIKEAVVLPGEANDGDMYLCAYLVLEPDASLSSQEMRLHLSKWLPDYMVPACFIQMETIPLTVNGKVDKKALPNPLSTGLANQAARVAAPENQTQATIQKIWEEELSISPIGIFDNFFDVGGHSLKAVAVVNRLHKTFAIEITIRQLFQHPTIARTAQFIQTARVSGFTQIPKQPDSPHYELSYAQKRIWFIDKQRSLENKGTEKDKNTENTNGQAGSIFNMPGKITLHEAVDEALVKHVLQQLTARHESLRTAFKEVHRLPVQVIAPVDHITLNFEILDLTPLPPEEATRRRNNLIMEEAFYSFNLQTAPLFRVKLVKCRPQEYDLVFNMHHIISDGASLEILTKEFTRYYQDLKNRKPIAPEPLELQYRDYAAWQNQLLADDTKTGKALAFWQALLSGDLEVLNLPYDFKPGSFQSTQNTGCAAFRRVIPAHLTQKLRKLAADRQASLFMVLLAGFNLLLAKLSGQKDIIMAIPAASRQHDALKNIIGLFVNTLILRNHIQPGQPFPEFFETFKDRTFSVLEYQAIPMELIFSHLKIKYPDVSVFFNMVNTGDTHLLTLDNLDPIHEAEVKEVKFPLSCYAVEYGNGIELRCEYFRSRFKPQTIQVFTDLLINMLESIAADSTKKIETYGSAGQSEKPKRLKRRKKIKNRKTIQ